MSFFSDASLVYVPSGVKDAKTYSIKPTDGSGDLTFSRGSDIEATRVASNGYIEKAKVNLVLQSNQFDTSWALSSGISLTSGQSGYDGTSDAWLLKRSDTSARYMYQNITQSAGVYTYSIYAKAETVDWIYLYSSDGTNNTTAYFDLANGALGTAAGAITSKIESVGGGWHRCTVSYLDDITSVRIYPAVADGSITGGVSPAGIYIQDAQLNYGLVAQEYQETTTTSVVSGITNDMPRLNYDPANPTCPSLLLEPSRTNLIPHSEYFGAWTLGGTTTIDFGYLAPDGTNSAYKVTNVSSGSISYSGVVDQNYSRTIYARTTSGTGTAQLCSYFGNTNNIFTITEEWQRFEVNTTTTATGATNFYGVDFRGVGTLSEIILWGAQSENASYASSYIPTYGTSATRTSEPDGLGKVDLITDGFFSSTELTWFMDIDLYERDGGSTVAPRLISSSNSQVFIGFNTGSVGTTFSIRHKDGTTALNTSTTPFNENGQRFKVCVKISGTTGEAFINGSSVGSFTTLAASNYDKFENAAPNAYDLRQMLMFPTALSDAEAITLTSL